jgi:NADPH:quinone reductase-like Zn-dependent oxidoreductase
VRKPLQVIQVPTVKPEKGEIRVEVHWVGSTPLDMHQADGGFLVTHPQVLGDTIAGEVVEVGAGVKDLTVGEKVCCLSSTILSKAEILTQIIQVFGFSWAKPQQKAQQQYLTSPAHLFGKLPSNIAPEAAVTVPSSFVTSWHTFVTGLSIPLPYPKPDSYSPPHLATPILIWGASSSVGQFALQILKYYGYTNVSATASKRHHEFLKELGANHTYDYTDDESVGALGAKLQGSVGAKVLDCIGSQEGSLTPLAKIVPSGSTVAVLLPVILKHSSKDTAPEYSMDVQASVPWKEGVTTAAVRTHFYEQNQFHKENLQPVIMPTLLSQGVITPNRHRVVEGTTLLERAQKALDILRNRGVSGERLVWRVKDE